MDVEEFKQKYEELKDNPMYQKYCSVLETKDKIIKKVKQENEHLKEQVAYLRRSVERKENRIIELEDERIPYTNEYVKKLEKQNQELKKLLEVGEEQYNDLVEEKENSQEQLSNSHQIKTQQKEFIEWLEDGIRTLEMLDETFILQNYKNEIRIYKEILSKYKEIVGVKE